MYDNKVYAHHFTFLVKFRSSLTAKGSMEPREVAHMHLYVLVQAGLANP